MKKSRIDKQKYIENHLLVTKEYFEVVEKYLKYLKSEIKTIEKINNKQ
ncbi:MAG: hypothetical protein ACD_20C00418G0004 [uncultured bacterium]|nr:MAG: hypothetical protein ACD_20C00418G0004 [uncultured bacterium]